MAHPHTQVWAAVDSEVWVVSFVDWMLSSLLTVTNSGTKAWRAPNGSLSRLLAADVAPRRGDVDGQCVAGVPAGQHIGAGLEKATCFIGLNG